MSTKTLAIAAISLSALVLIGNLMLSQARHADDEWEQQDITAYHSMAVESKTNDGYHLITHIAIKGRISEERTELINRIVKGATAEYDPNSAESRAQAEVEIGANLKHKLVPVRDISIWEKRIEIKCDKTGCYNTPLKGK